MKIFITIISLMILLCSEIFALYTDGVNMPHKITIYNPDRGPVAVAGLDFSTSLTVNVDGVLVRVESSGAQYLSQFIRVTAFVDDPENEIMYIFYPKDGTVKMVGGFGEIYYTKDGNPEMNYIVLDRIKDLLAAAYAEIGLFFNADTNELTINKGIYLAGADPQLDLDVVNEAGKVFIIASKGDKISTVTYDIAGGIINYPEGVDFAPGYEWDVAGGGNLVALEDPPDMTASGVRATAEIDDWIYSVSLLWSLPMGLVYSAVNIKDDYLEMQEVANTEVAPMPRLAEPEIIDVTWVDRADGLVEIKGRGGNSEYPPEIYIKKGAETKCLVDTLFSVDDLWTITNHSAKLADGENKINVIVRGSGNRELETGDVTVYKGVGSEPDLILLSPRDRQLMEHKDISGAVFQEKEIIVKGKTSADANMQIEGKKIHIYSDGSFDEPKEVSFLEGNNNISIMVSTSLHDISIIKNVVGAYEFINNYKPQAYILRKADFVFNGTDTEHEMYNGFAPIPYDPDHTGIYIGDGNLAEAVWNEIVERPLMDTKDWNSSSFWYAVQVPKLVSEENRKKIAALVLMCQKSNDPKYTYDWPVKPSQKRDRIYSLSGHYDGPKNGFYCSELAYWAWEKTAVQEGFDFGIVRKEIMFPELGEDDPIHCSILPAFLCKKSMEAKRIDK